MKKFIIFVFLSIGFVKSNNAAITVYKDGYALIRQKITFEMKVGSNLFAYPDLPDKMEPGSVFLSIPEGDIVSQKYNTDVFNTFTYLKSRLGMNVTVKMTQSKSVKGQLVDVDNRWMSIKSKNQVHILNMNEVSEVTTTNKAKNTFVNSSMEWTVHSTSGGKVDGEVVYISGGFDWNANYRLVISPDENMGILVSQAEVANNTNQDFVTSSLELVEGDLRRRRRNSSKSSISHITTQTGSGVGDGFQIESSRDFVLYSLPESLTLPKHESITISLYSDKEVKLDRTYVFENAERVKSEEPLAIEISFANGRSSMDVPLPAGIFQIYQRTENGGIIFAGEDALPQTAIGENITVVAGRAFNVLGKRTVMNYDRKKKSEEATILLELKNNRNDLVNIRITEHIFGDWVIRDPSHDYRKVDAETIQFDIVMSPSSSETVTYTYRKEWQ